MIASVIILGSLALAVAFAVAWLLRPALREAVERPKHWFTDRARQYDLGSADGSQRTHDDI